jgi:hypothetical protein
MNPPTDFSLLANEIEGRRPPNQDFKSSSGKKTNNMNAPSGFEGVVIVLGYFYRKSSSRFSYVLSKIQNRN